MENGDYCSKCQEEADANATGKPVCGCIADRLAVDYYEYKDSKGRKPIPYAKLLYKLKITKTDAEDNPALGLYFEIPQIHFDFIDKPTRGRQKKEADNVQSEEHVELFEELSVSEEEPLFDYLERVADTIPPELVKENNKKSAKSAKETKKKDDNEDEDKKAEKAAEKATAKAAKEAEKEAKEADKAAAKAEKEAEKAAAKAEKEAEKAAAKAAKEAKKKEKV
jgi:hypothetical protein